MVRRTVRRQRRNNSGANWRKRDVGGPVQGAVAGGKGTGPGPRPCEAMTALCSTIVPGPCGPDKEEFAVKRPLPLPFSTAERNELFLLRQSLLDGEKSTKANLPLQRKQLTVSDLLKVIPLLFRGITLRKQLIYRCLHCSAKRSAHQETLITDRRRRRCGEDGSTRKLTTTAGPSPARRAWGESTP